MPRTLCGIFFGIIITREELKEYFKDDLDRLFRENKKKKMKDLDDFLDGSKGLEIVQDKLLPEGQTLILSSDHFDCCDDRVDDMILGIEIKVVNIRKKKGPTSFDFDHEDRVDFQEFLLAAGIKKDPKFILRAPV
jgi:hypothetical protein